MKKILPAVISLLSILCFITACGFNNPGYNPGEVGYTPPGWTDPELFYEEEEYFASRVVDYRQAPGQFYKSSDYSIENNVEKLLGPPSGGGIFGSDNSSIVSLGMAGGYVILQFDVPIENHPDNMGGYDFIVFGNSFWSGGSPESPLREPGVIEIMEDENGDGIPNDIWYLIPGSHLSVSDLPVDINYSVQWYDTVDSTLSWSVQPGSLSGTQLFSDSQAWWNSQAENPAYFDHVYLLPDSVYYSTGGFAAVWGSADSAPTSVLGDLNGDGDTKDMEDYPGIKPSWFYTVPDTHGDNRIDDGSGGGSAIKIEWAVDADFISAELDRISWIKISSASLKIHDALGELSCEVDAVARVRRE
ncbi:MAG: hypothetical protein JEY99_14730 [Spirochaetales bacterium]|nr:hypothetical protein [Spirochaetales bacterium]